MAAVECEIRRGAYHDSVVLMQLQRALLQLPGVQDAGVVMATPANQELLQQSNLLPEAARTAGADDLLIVVRAGDAASALAALAQVDALLARRRSGGDQEYRPRSLESAFKQMPEAAWVLVSTPGRFAAGVAREALQHRRHVFLYSDNVPLADEVALKQMARELGLLVMGPDCGTAIVNGVGLGFANRVRRGPVGLVGASGTGLQAVSVRVDALGSGISHALGAGGRDLKTEVGAITMLQGLDLLARDPATRVIGLISKPPAPQVAARLLRAAQALGKPVVVDFIGYPPPARRLGNLHFAAGLSEAAELAVSLLEAPPAPAISAPAVSGYLRGLFSGGTLAYEALLGLQATLHPLFSNAPIHPEQNLADPLRSQAHTILDLGEDDFTVGRLHPMLDNDLRLRRLRQEAADPECGLILLDVVLGEGAHADPASELAPAIAEIRQARSLEIVVMLIGTQADPQNLSAQREQFQAAGAAVFLDPTEALAYVSRCLGSDAPVAGAPVALDRLQAPLAAVNVGLESFHLSLLAQGARSLHVDWKPPAAGNERLAGLLARLKK